MDLLVNIGATFLEFILVVPYLAWGVYTLRYRYRYHEELSPYVEGGTLAVLVVWYWVQVQILREWLGDTPILLFFAVLGLFVSGTALYGPMFVSLVAQLTVDLLLPKDKDLQDQPRLGPAEALERHGDYEAAVQEYMVIARMFPKDPTTAVRLADNLMKLDRPAEAAPWFERALRFIPSPDKALRITNRLVEIYTRHLDEPARARASLELYLERFPETEFTASVRDRLARLEPGSLPETHHSPAV